MASLPRPLWEILLAAESNDPRELTYDECFAIIEYLADELAGGADSQTIKQAAQRRLTHCPNCRQHHERRLREIETTLAEQKL